MVNPPSSPLCDAQRQGLQIGNLSMTALHGSARARHRLLLSRQLSSHGAEHGARPAAAGGTSGQAASDHDINEQRLQPPFTGSAVRRRLPPHLRLEQQEAAVAGGGHQPPSARQRRQPRDLAAGEAGAARHRRLLVHAPLRVRPAHGSTSRGSGAAEPLACSCMVDGTLQQAHWARLDDGTESTCLILPRFEAS